MKKHGFSLAEVLITLGIIGVVAAMTLPALITSYKEKETVTRLKKVYSTIQTAYNYTMMEEGPTKFWGALRGVETGGELVLLDKFSKYMRFTKICGHDKGCFPDQPYLTVKGTEYANWNELGDRAKAILPDGTLIMFNMTKAGESDAQIYVDLNGFKGPNKLGDDFHYFFVYDNKIIPAGAPETQGEDYFVQYCLTEKGYGCTAWALYNENLDYLHCTDLEWNGKTKCK